MFLGGFQFFHPCGQIFVGRQKVAHLDEGADYQDVHLRGAVAIQHLLQDRHAVLGESVWKIPASAIP